MKIIAFVLLMGFTNAGHYKGGTITWKPVDPYANGSTIEVIIYQQHTWTLSRFACDRNKIHNLGWYNDGGSMSVSEPFVNCYSASAACVASLYTPIRERTYCTDFSTVLQSSTGALIKRKTLARNTNIVIGFSSVAWASEIKSTNTSFPASTWRVVTRIDLTKNYPINSSPVTGSSPIIRVIEGRQASIPIPTIDWDLTNDVRCRWAVKSGTAGDECGDICGNLVTATIGTSDCTITWNAVRRPSDISSNIPTSTYIAAIMVEDFNSTTDTVPMSAVPLQIAIVVYLNPAGACNIAPTVIGDRSNRACIGIPIGVTLIERIVAKVYCSGDSIVEIITNSPLFMNITSLTQVSGTTNQWYINLLWTPTQDQKGSHVFCAAPTDQRGSTGRQHCITFIVGYPVPNVTIPAFVQGSASPVGTVFSNHSLFSIQATSGVNRPSRNGTYISIYEQLNPFNPVWQIDCGYSPDCIFTGNTTIFTVQYPNWSYGASYYILIDSGAVSSGGFCAPESTPILNASYWVFDIWDPRVLTTTVPTTTTTSSTMTTVTTSVTTSVVVTTTTSTTTTTSMNTTTIPTKNVLSAKEYEEKCVQSIGIMNAVMMLGMVPFRLILMFLLMSMAEKMFNPNRLLTTTRVKALHLPTNNRQEEPTT